VFQIGANGAADQQVTLYIADMGGASLGISGTDIATRTTANSAIAALDTAINMVSGERANLGAMQNRLEHTLNTLGVAEENLQAAESSIRDVDMAKDMMIFTKNSILMQAGQSMLAQANRLPSGILQLLH
jgi:flagellin